MKIIQLLILFIILISCNKLTEKTTFYKNGKMKERYFVDENGKKQGVYRSFHKNGKLDIYTVYKNDKGNGIYKEFYESGILELSGHAKMDKLDGELKLFSEKGELEMYQLFFDDSLGIEKKYYHNNILKSVKSFIGLNGDLNSYLQYNEKGIRTGAYKYGEWRKIKDNKIQFFLYDSHLIADSTLIQFKKKISDTKVIREFWVQSLNKFVLEIKDDDYHNNCLNIVIGNYTAEHTTFYSENYKVITIPSFDNYYFQIDKGEKPKKFNLDYIDVR